MKKLSLLLGLVFVLFTQISLAQAPAKFSYQAVARNSEGEVLSNQSIGVQMSILSGSSSGNISYQETHTTTTDAYGVINLTIGNGTTVTGAMGTIDWAIAAHYISIEIDPTGGETYSLSGSSQLLSVPYALHAATAIHAENNTGSLDDADADPSNETITSISFDGSILTVTEAGADTQVNLTQLVDDADADITNELITASEIDLVNGELNITQGGNVFSIDISSILADNTIDNELIERTYLDGSILWIVEANDSVSADLSNLIITPDPDEDPENELIQTVMFDGTVLSIQEGDTTYLIDFSNLDNNVDADNDAGNELISTVVLNGNNLQITESGTLKTVDLSSIILDNNPNNELLTGITLNGTQLEITDAGGTTTVELATLLGADDNATNELIQSAAIFGTNLNITDAGGVTTVDLATLNNNELTKDGLTALLGNWDAGDFGIRAQTYYADVATGTSPFTILSTTLVTNLNADMVDGIHGTNLLVRDGSQGLTGHLNAATFRVINLGEPSASNDATTKSYVDLRTGSNEIDPTIGTLTNNSLTKWDGSKITDSNIGEDGTDVLLTVTGSVKIPTNTILALSDDLEEQISSNGSHLVLDAGSQFKFRVGGAEKLSFDGNTLNFTSTNTFVGSAAGTDIAAGLNNTAYGYFSGTNLTDGIGNTFIGTNSGYTMLGGLKNTFIGQSAGNASIGNENTYIGSEAGNRNSAGIANTMLGAQAGYNNLVGDSSIYIGYKAGWNETTSSKLYIENSDAAVPLIYGDFINDKVGINVIATRTLSVGGDAGGTSPWNNDSDLRLKKNIQTIDNPIDKIMGLRGVYYQWKDTDTHSEGQQMGFIAQEALEVIPEVVSKPGDYYNMQYAPITALLVEAVKAQQKKIETLEASIALMSASANASTDQIEALTSLLENLSKRMNTLEGIYSAQR